MNEKHLTQCFTDGGTLLLIDILLVSPNGGVLLLCGFVFRGFSDPQSTAIQKYYMENSRSKQFISLKVCTFQRVM